MKKRILITAGCFFLLNSFSFSHAMRKSNTSYAEFEKKGYKVEVQWQQKKNILRISGVVSEGEQCNQLNLSIFFRNSKDSSIGHVEVALRKYDPHFGKKYKGKDKVYAIRKYRKNWHVSSFYIDCL